MLKRKLGFLSDFIQLFAEGGGEGGTGGGEAGGAPAAGQNDAAPARPQSARNPLAGVQYGIQEGGANDVSGDRKSQFDALIKGEYKDLYEAQIQDVIQKRLKGTNETVQKYKSLEPVMDLLGKKYGIDAGNAEALAKAIEEDETYYEDEALERGLSVQQVKELRKIERENSQLREQMRKQKVQQQTDAILADWYKQAETVKTVYPAFDLQGELQNEQFRTLLTSGVPVQTAFEVIHKDEIMPAAMQYTAQKITEKVANNIRSGMNRPQEGAMGSRSSVVVKSDVSQLTRADRDEIERRVRRGEKIRF